MSNDPGHTHEPSSWHEPRSNSPQRVSEAQWTQEDAEDVNVLWESYKPTLAEEPSTEIPFNEIQFNEIQSDETQQEQDTYPSALLRENLESSEDANCIWDFQKPEFLGPAESKKAPDQSSSLAEIPQHPTSQNWLWGRIVNIPPPADILSLPLDQRHAALNPLGAKLSTAALQQAFRLNSATSAIALGLRQEKSGTGVLGLDPNGTVYRANYCRKDVQWYIEFAQYWQDRKNYSKEEKDKQQAHLVQLYIDQKPEAIDEWNEFYNNIATQFISPEQQQALQDFILQLKRESLWEGLTADQAHQDRATAKATDLETQIDGKLSVQAKQGIFLDSLFWAYRQVQEIRYFKRSLTSKERNNLDLLFSAQPDPPDDSRSILSSAVSGEIAQWANAEYQNITGHEQANPAGELWKTLQSAALMNLYPNIWNQVLAGIPVQKMQLDLTLEGQEENLSLQSSSTQEDITTDREHEALQRQQVDATSAKLQANKVRFNSQARSYTQDLSPSSRPWIELRSLSQQDQRLAQRHSQLEHQFEDLAKENAEIYLLVNDSNAETPSEAKRLGPSAQERTEAIQAQSEEILAQIELIEKTRRFMMCQFPALGMIDTWKVSQAANTPQINEEILDTLSQGFSNIRYTIDDLQEQIAQDPSQVMHLTAGEMVEIVLAPMAIALLEGVAALETANDILTLATSDPTTKAAQLNQAEATVHLMFSETLRSNLVLGQGNILLAGLDAGLSAVEIETLGRLPILQGFAGSLSATDMTLLMRGLKAGLDGQMTAGLAAIRPLKQKLLDVHQDLTWLIRQAGKGGDMVYNAERQGFQRSQPIEFIVDRLELLQDRLGLGKILDWVCNSAQSDL
jgi:hypothetical protein